MKRKTFLASFICLTVYFSNGQLTQTSLKLKTNPIIPSQYIWFIAGKNRIASLVNNAGSAQVMDTKTQATSAGKVEMGVGFIPAPNSKTVNSSVATNTGTAACFKKNISLNLLANQDFSILQQSLSSKIFPGAFFKATSVINQAFTFYNSPARKPLKAVIDLPAYATNGLREITLDNPGTFQTTKFDSLRSSNFGVNLPAMIGALSEDFSSKLELAASLEASAGIFLPLEEFDIPLEVNAGDAGNASLSGSVSLKHYLFKLIQPMFTISTQSPNPADWFVDPQAYKNCSDGVMVNAVTYGRMVFIMVNSFESEAKVKAAISAKLGLTFTDANVDIGDNISGSGSVDFTVVIKTFKAVIIGGNANAANKVIADADQLKNYITTSSAGKLTGATGALPIAYSLVRISDNSNVGIRSTATYDVVEDCVPFMGYSIYVKNFAPSKVVDNPLAGNNEDLFGTITVKAFYKNANGTDIEIKDDQQRGAKVWENSESSPLQLKENEYYYLYKTDQSVTDGKRKFLFTPEQAKTGYILIQYRIKDKIMQDGEQLGNSNSSVKYEEKDFKYYLSDWADMKDVSGCTYELKEIGGDAKICINFSKYKE